MGTLKSKSELKNTVDTNRNKTKQQQQYKKNEKEKKKKISNNLFSKTEKGILDLYVSTLDLDAWGQSSSVAEQELLGTDYTVSPRKTSCGFLHGP